jgi:hypothetical protein
MAKLDGKTEPVMIPPVMANDLEILIGERVVAGNLPLSHRKVRFEKFRPLCSGQQFVRWNGAAPDSGGGVLKSNSFGCGYFRTTAKGAQNQRVGLKRVGIE